MRGAAAVPARSPGARVAAVAAALLVVLLLVPAVEAQLLHEKGPGYGRTLRPALPVTGKSPPAWSAVNPQCTKESVDRFTTSHAWMSRLPDETKIFLDLSIPGTHGSASYVFKDGSNFQSQSNTITQQLEAGIRFLDMPLAFIRSTMYVAYNRQPVASEAVTFQHAMQQVTSFLDKNPREVVLIRVGRAHVKNSTMYEWRDEWALDEFDLYISTGTHRDTACRDVFCALGMSRGRVLFVDTNLNVKGLSFLPYNDSFASRLESAPLQRYADLHARWEEAMDMLEWASLVRAPFSPWAESKSGMVLFFSPAHQLGDSNVAIPSYFAASGQQNFTVNDRYRLTEMKEMDRREMYCVYTGTDIPYPDFPRVDCKGCGKETTCEIAFEGMNRLLYTWLRRGLTGQRQSYHLRSIHVYPRYLGILALDFPDNALIDIIVSLNFLPPDRYKEPAFTIQSPGVRPFACKKNYCAASGALSADAYVQTVNRGRIVAGKVVEGDELHPGLLEADAGAEGAPPKTCRVMAVTPGDNAYDRSNTLNGVSGLAVVTSPKGGANGVVVVEQGAAVGGLPPGQVSVTTPQSLVTIVTDCGAIAGPVSNETGSDNGGPPVFYGEEGVTPFPSLCWRVKPSYASSDAALTTGTEYNRVYAAVMRVVNRTGTFWFDPRAYVEANTCAAFRGDPGVDVVAGEGARLSSERSVNGVVTLTGRLTQCLTDFETAAADSESRDVVVPASCKALEVEATQWIRAHVSWRKHGGVLDEAYPHMGNPESETGNLLFDILPPFGRKPGP